MSGAVLERVAKAVLAAMRKARDGADIDLVWRVSTDEDRAHAERVAVAAVTEYVAAVGEQRTG